MYLEYYGFEREPFHITPDPEFLFLSPSHKEAFATVVYGVEQRKGFVALTGEVGTGKTTILRAYLKRIERSPIRPIYLFNPDLTFDELLRLILREMGEEAKGEPVQNMLDRLQWLLVEAYKENHNVVLIIDEAQNMPVETLEKLRMLSNLETTKDKLIQIVLVGQSELQEKLELHDLRQLRQRIAVRAIIRALTPAQSFEYIRYRLTQAGCLRESVFSKAALRVIVRRAKGNPRLLNILCDNSLIAGFGALEQSVSAKIVREVARDVFGNPWKKASLKWAVAAAGTVLVGGISVVLASAGTTGSDVANSQDALQVARVAAPVEAVSAPPGVVPTEPAQAPQAPPPASPVVNAPASDAVVAMPAEEIGAPIPVAAPRAEDKPPVEPLPAKTLDHKDIALRKMNELMARRDQPLPTESASVETVSAPEAAVPPAAPVSEPSGPKVSEEVTVSASAPPATPPAVPIPEPESAPEITPADREIDAVEAPATPADADSTDAPAQGAVPEPDIQLASAQPVAAAPAAAEAPVAAPQPAAPMGTAVESPETAVAPAASVESKKPEPLAASEVTQRPARPATTVTDAAGETIRLLPRYVQRGDCLTRLVAEVYGRSTPSLVETVRRYNPHVLNADIIWYGDTLVFPERIVDERGVVQTASIPGDAAPGE